MSKIAPYLKAIVAAVIAGLTAIATGLDDSSIDWQEIITAVIAFLTGLLAVWRTPNRAAP